MKRIERHIVKRPATWKIATICAAMIGSSLFGAGAAMASTPDPDVPTNANDARCISMPWVLACGGSKFGGVPGAFDNLPGEAGDIPGM